MIGQSAAEQVGMIVYRALATAEARAPAASRGAFNPARNAFDALAAVSKVFGSAKTDLLIVDPYLGEKVLTDFARLAAERIAVRLLADAQGVKPTLAPAFTRWVHQYNTARPLERRVALARSRHDRLMIVDCTDAWVLTQSFRDLASRAPASLVKSTPDVAALSPFQAR